MSNPKFSTKSMVIFVVSLGLFMESLDTTIINTAIPAMSRSLLVNPIDLKLALISYLLSLSIFIPISGWVADKWGAKRVFIIALSVFILSSFWCGFAHNLTELVIARAVQGIGGSFALPVGRLILLRVFPRHEVFMIMSRVIMVAASGMMLGPLLGGFITHYFTWPWIFWVNLPVGLLTIFLAQKSLPHVPLVKVAHLDKLGFVLFGAWLALLIFGLSALSESVLSLQLSLSFVVLSFVFLALYISHSFRYPHPIVKTELFRYRTFQVSTAANLFARLGFGGMPFLLPILMQVAMGFSAQLSGLLIAPMAIGIFAIKIFSLRLLKLMGYRKLLIVNTLLMALSLWSFMTIGVGTSVFYIALLTFVFGFLMSMQFSGMNSLAYADIPVEYLSAATSIMNTLQQVASSFGVASAALLIHYFSMQYHVNFLLNMTVFHRTFFVLGCLTLFASAIFLRLQPEDGASMLQKAEG